jgi:peptidylprolyl isomerase/peptidyl-prolyl cis-trans isomerase B (cyclophilin B)
MSVRRRTELAGAAILAVFLTVQFPFAVSGAGPSEPSARGAAPESSVSIVGKGPRAVLDTTRGVLVIELFPDVAPKTVARFTELVKKGFYDGLPFYRVLPKFLVQTGDPLADGTGGSGQIIPAEFNDKRHVAGTVGMARKQDPDSADSQFYITLEPQPLLDGKYTVFGQVIEGLEILPKIQERDTVRKLTLKP